MRLLLLAFLTAMASQAGPCVQATAACTERVPLGADGKYSVVYRTFPLTSRNDVAQRALVVVHGSDRNADHYFASGLAAAFLAGGLEDTIVLSPRFGSNDGKGCADRLAKGEISWDCAGDWKGGAEAINAPGRYSFDLLDAVLRHLADRSLFPNLRVIVVSGHSGGGQVTQRYAEVNKLHEGLGVPVRYVAANSGSYGYLDALRIPSGVSCEIDLRCAGAFERYAGAPACPAFDQWKSGLERRTGYSAELSDAEIRKQYAARPVTYLIGELDTLPNAGFDSSCAAMAQGANRRARAMNFFNEVNGKYGAKHELVIVPLCGHNGRCMLTSDEALPLLFPKL